MAKYQGGLGGAAGWGGGILVKWTVRRLMEDDRQTDDQTDGE